jgi:hypothetical protein
MRNESRSQFKPCIVRPRASCRRAVTAGAMPKNPAVAAALRASTIGVQSILAESINPRPVLAEHDFPATDSEPLAELGK